MPVIIIENLQRKKISFSDESQVLKVLQENYIDWMHSCGGKGRCTTCKMIVKNGMESLSPLSLFERKCRNSDLLKDNERLACQCAVSGNLIIRVPEETRLPHIDYSD